jgi:hypothetical protein
MQRLTLICLRRMAAHGIRDARASLLVFDAFGIHFRRPLVLLRAFLSELAQCSERSISLAPCCAHRMTADEARLIGVLATAANSLDCARYQLGVLTRSERVESPLSLARAFNLTLAELGQPLAL